MKNKIPQIEFVNQNLPSSHFDLIRLEELFEREIDHEITNIHTVNFYILLIITENQGYHTIDFTDYKYQKGTVLTIRKDQIHKFFKSKTKGFLLLFTEGFITGYLEKLEVLKTFQLFNELLGDPKIQLDKTEYADIIQTTQKLENEYFKIRDEYSSGIIRSLLHILITILYRAKSKSKSTISDKKYLSEFIEFQKLVEKHCFETKKVLDYANKLGFSTKTLNKVVKSIVHKSAKTFIDEIVVTNIKRQLIHSHLSVKEIAYTAGFEEPSNLYKYFKKYTDTSPEAFRKAYQ